MRPRAELTRWWAGGAGLWLGVRVFYFFLKTKSFLIGTKMISVAEHGRLASNNYLLNSNRLVRKFGWLLFG